MLSTIMSLLHCFTFLTLTVLMNLGGVTSVELTFELPDSAKECFHEIIEKDVESTLEFQVSPSSHRVSLTSALPAGCYWRSLRCRRYINGPDEESFI